MDWFQQFFWGFAGSAAVEIVVLARVFASSTPLPCRYKRTGYWVVRFLLALIGGLLVVAGQVKLPLLAMQIGAITPLIVKSWSKRPAALESRQE